MVILKAFMSKEGGEVTIECGVCMRSMPVDQMVQILPCLHLFCNDCIANAEQSLEQKKIRHMKKKKRNIFWDLELKCLAQNCYSIVRQAHPTHTLNNCDYELCPRKLSLFESAHAASCIHELCSGCLDEALQSKNPVCPVEGCNESLAEGDLPDVCEDCKKAIHDTKYIATQCCKTIYCNNCAEKSFKVKLTNETNETIACPEGRCPRKKKSKKRAPVTIALCCGEEGCMGTALNGFPSAGECEHEVCLQCLERMIEDCQVSGSIPYCPNSLCRQPYNIDSVSALKAMLPQKAEYFGGLALENQGYDAIKDDSVTVSDISADFTITSRRMQVKVETDGGDEGEIIVTFDKNGNVADFIRELRRALKILPFDKVYGIYLRRESEGKKPDEELTVDSHSLMKPIGELGITPETIVIVDLSGIVQPKSPVKQ